MEHKTSWKVQLDILYLTMIDIYALSNGKRRQHLAFVNAPNTPRLKLGDPEEKNVNF